MTSLSLMMSKRSFLIFAVLVDTSIVVLGLKFCFTQYRFLFLERKVT